jgi:hypothetical protein
MIIFLNILIVLGFIIAIGGFYSKNYYDERNMGVAYFGLVVTLIFILILRTQKEWIIKPNQYDLVAEHTKCIVAKYSETDWEGYTDTWSEEASDMYYTFVVNGKLQDHKGTYKNYGVSFVPDKPPVIINHSGKKHFTGRYGLQENVSYKIEFLKHKNVLSSTDYVNYIKLKNNNKDLYYTTICGFSFNVRTNK